MPGEGEEGVLPVEKENGVGSGEEVLGGGGAAGTWRDKNGVGTEGGDVSDGVG